eukprot:TRINITY_DN2107_c0_g2_i1.p2 TRINITY_DN2107_c0_g2~~TRINITY_DN2107_c0_g2_i1.p2  ORF type:complete len:108 (-),score=36.53 TRINITY_DN2107_c0_g2_i1:509-832(-)
MATSRRAMLSLYRSVLRSHHALPPFMRVLGDTYVREEWRKHRGAGPQFVQAFTRQWEEYAMAVRGAQKAGGGAAVGRDLSPQQLQSLSPEQREKLRQLEDRSRHSSS